MLCVRSKMLWLCTSLILGAMASFSQVQNNRAVRDAFREFTIVRSELSDSPAPISVGRKVLEAQRADGSRVSGEVILKGDDIVPPTLRDITLAPERMKVRVDDALKAKTTMYMRGPAPTHPPAADPQCGISHLTPQVKPTIIGEETILGFKTVVIQTEMQGPDESYVTKSWKAPDLDCAELRMNEIRRNPAGETIGEFRSEVVKITVGPPAPELFIVPADYAEKSPSQMHQAYLQQVGDPGRQMPGSTRKALEREDQRYFANQKTPH